MPTPYEDSLQADAQRLSRLLGGGAPQAQPDMAALAQALTSDGSPTPRAIVDALRGREALGEAGMAGGEWIRSAAAPVVQGARQRLGEENARESAILKRSLWGQGRGGEIPLNQKLLDLAPDLGLDAEALAAMPPKQASNIVSQRLVQRAAEADKAERLRSPEAQAERAAKEEAARIDRAAKLTQIDAAKQMIESRERENEGAAKMGRDWVLGPDSPLKKDDTLKRDFIKTSAAVREMRGLAQHLREKIKAGLGVTSSAEVKTDVAATIARLQLLQKQADVLGVLSAVDISEFVNPQLRNPTSFNSVWKEWTQQYDPASQIDRYISNMETKIAEMSDAYDVNPTPDGAFGGIRRGAKGNAAAPGKIRVRIKATGQTGMLSEQYFDPAKYEKIP